MNLWTIADYQRIRLPEFDTHLVKNGTHLTNRKLSCIRNQLAVRSMHETLQAEDRKQYHENKQNVCEHIPEC